MAVVVPLLSKIDEVLAKLDDESDRSLVRDLLAVAEYARTHVEMGYGSYRLMRAVSKVYEPEKLNMERWTK